MNTTYRAYFDRLKIIMSYSDIPVYTVKKRTTFTFIRYINGLEDALKYIQTPNIIIRNSHADVNNGEHSDLSIMRTAWGINKHTYLHLSQDKFNIKYPNSVISY